MADTKKQTKGMRKLMRKSAKLFLAALLAGGGLYGASYAFAADPAVIAQAKQLQATKPAEAIKTLKGALAHSTNAEEQSAIRMGLVDAYIAHGRPIDASAELATWLKSNASSSQREKAVLTLIACQRQANEWDAAAGTSRSFVKDFATSASREAVLVGLIEIARYGQQNLSSEMSAINEYIAAFPNAKDLDARMLRLAKVQEQTGDLAGAVATIQKFVEKFPQHEQANDMGWRAVWLLQDRLRKAPEAVAAAEAHLKKFAKRPTISRDWQYAGDIARQIDKPADAMNAYRNALSADANNRDAAAALLDTAARSGSLADVQSAAGMIEKNFAGQRIAHDARIALMRKQLGEKNANGAAIFDQAAKMLASGYRTLDVCGVIEFAAPLAVGQGGDANAKVAELYRQQIQQLKGMSRSDVAVRLAAVLRGQNQLKESLAVLAAELKDNPVNRRELTRDYLTSIIDSQSAEVAAKKRTRYDFEPSFKEVAEMVRSYAYLPELRLGMDDAAAPLNRLKLKDATNALRQEIERLNNTPIAVAVDTILREGNRDASRVTDALNLLLKETKEKPVLFEIADRAVWFSFDRLREDLKPRLLPWLAAWADAKPGDLGLNREVGEAFRRFGKNAEAAKYLQRVVDAEANADSAWQIGVAMGSLMDLQAYTIKEAGAVQKLADRLEKIGSAMPASVRQERYRQLADIAGREKDGKAKQIEYYRKAMALGLTDQSLEAAKSLLNLLPTDDAVKLGKELLADSANARFAPELSLIVASKIAFGQKDLPAAVDMLAKAHVRRETTPVRAEGEEAVVLRDLIKLASQAADPKAGYKALSPEQYETLMTTSLRWLSGQPLHEVAREAIRRAGAAKDYSTQLDIYSRTLARTRPNDPYHWSQNIAIANDEISRQNLGTASTMLRLLLKQSAQYTEEARQAARNTLMQTYAKFGEDLLAVSDSNSPIAALLKGANYLKLGEEKQALEIYQANSKLFAEKIDEVPAEYVLFVGDFLAHNSDADRDVAEQLLRTWLARSEKHAVEAGLKASVSLKLADVFFWGRRYDVARAEYQSVIDRFPDTQQATDAQFRIGESLMHQKNYAEAGKVFEKLRKSKEAETAIRGTFMSGVLQYTQGSRDEARETFKTLLDLSPNEEIASKTLFQLALIYGEDKRFKEMLDMLQAIGTQGTGKKWHTPGQMLTVMIHDPDLAIVQEASTVPVVIRTTTGDRETVNMLAGSAGRGIFMASIPTALGSPRIGDGTLQVLGNDTITYDYPEEFKKKFKFIPPPQGNIRIAADATFAASATLIEEEAKTSVVESHKETSKIKRTTESASQVRSGGSFRPGNPIYLKVVDPDRAVTTGINHVEVTLQAASGDTVRVSIPETGPDTGIFEGKVQTAERPPETIASDSALSHPAAFAGDKDPATAWESQHDGLAGKWITADLKDLYPVKSYKFEVPNKANAPTKWLLKSSVSGQMWEAVYCTEKDKVAHGLTLNYGPLRHTWWNWSKVKGAVGIAKAPTNYKEFAAMIATGKLPEGAFSPMPTLAMGDWEADSEADIHVISGYFPSSAGKYTFMLRHIKAQGAALVIDGQIVADGAGDFDKGVTCELGAGWHRFAAFLTTKGAKPAVAAPAAPAAAPKGRGAGAVEETQPGLAYVPAQARVAGVPIQFIPAPSGRDTSVPAPATYTVPAEPKVTIDANGGATVELASLPARMLKLDVLAYSGDFVSISGITVLGEDASKPLLPTDVNLVGLAEDDILQVSPGDTVTASYSDQINIKTPGTPRLLTSKLQATYFNATVRAITYDVKTGGAGQVSRTVKDLYRIDPGDRIVAQISDPDEDTTDKPDKVTLRVRTESGQELKDLEAIESGPTTGVFTKEIETTDKPTPGKLLVKPGEKIYLIYSDKLNTSPGSRVERAAEIGVVKPTDATMGILGTRVQSTENPVAKSDEHKPGKGGEAKVSARDMQQAAIYLPYATSQPSRIVLAAPLTVEVTDADCAKDSSSTVEIEITTSAGAKLTLPMEISDQCRPGGASAGRKTNAAGMAITATEEGRFVGQVLLVLGRPNAENKYGDAITVERARGLIGAWKYAASAAAGSITAPILPISGADTITAKYVDKRNPKGKEQTLTHTARMVTDATLANLDRAYDKPISLIHLGERLFIKVEDGDRDATPEQDTITVDLTTKYGQSMQVKLTETLGHSGVFTGEVLVQHISQKPASQPATQPATQPSADAGEGAQPTTAPSLVAQQILKTNFGDQITLKYVDEANSQGESPITRTVAIDVALGTDATMLAFTKQFGNEEVAVETQFKLAECWFELFKSHNSLQQMVEMKQSLEAGRSILADLRDNYRGSAYEARVLYLLGQFHQELKEWDPALDCFRTIVRVYPNAAQAPDAQYKLGQCYEDKRDMDLACEEYVRLAYTYPDSPLIAKCMVRLSDYFYKTAKFDVAANVCQQFLEQYPEHEWAAKIAFRAGQCHYKNGEALKGTAEAAPPNAKPAGDVAAAYAKGAKAFDFLIDRYTDADAELRANSMFWSGQSYHKAGDFAAAYRRYRRCTWDYPDTDAARYARGQLTLPEIAQAEAQEAKAGSAGPRR